MSVECHCDALVTRLQYFRVICSRIRYSCKWLGVKRCSHPAASRGVSAWRARSLPQSRTPCAMQMPHGNSGQRARPVGLGQVALSKIKHFGFTRKTAPVGTLRRTVVRGRGRVIIGSYTVLLGPFDRGR